MKKSFLECYETLGIPEACNWEIVRKKYKSLIQKNHPDRFIENSPEHRAAEVAIRSYNIAYKTLADFYSENNTLPPRVKEQIDKTIIQEPRRKKEKTPTPTPTHSKPSNKKLTKHYFSFRKAAFFLVLIFGLTSTQLYIASTRPDLISVQQDIEIVPPKITSHSSVLPESESTREQPIEKRYFTTGSSIGEVIIIQGQPTRTKGETWYYGESSVTFTKGSVSHWFRHPQYPLNAMRSENGAYQIKSKINTEIPASKETPYWRRNFSTN